MTIFSEMNFRSYITVNCKENMWDIRMHISTLQLRYPDFKDYDVYLGVHSCTGYHSGDYLIFDKEYASCGTIKQVLIDKFDSKYCNKYHKSISVYSLCSLHDLH